MVLKLDDGVFCCAGADARGVAAAIALNCCSMRYRSLAEADKDERQQLASSLHSCIGEPFIGLIGLVRERGGDRRDQRTIIYYTHTRTQLVRKADRNSRRHGSKQQQSSLIVRSEEETHLDPVARWANKPTCNAPARSEPMLVHNQHPRAHQMQREGQSNNDSIIPYREERVKGGG